MVFKVGPVAATLCRRYTGFLHVKSVAESNLKTKSHSPNAERIVLNPSADEFKILSTQPSLSGSGSNKEKPKSQRLGIWQTYKLEKAKLEAEERQGLVKTKRAALFEEAFSKGYFHDAKELVKVGLKPGRINSELFNEQKSFPFPNLNHLSPLSPGEASSCSLLQHVHDPKDASKVTLLIFFSSQLGEKQTTPWVEWYLSNGTKLGLNLVQLNVEENVAKAVVQRLFVPLLKLRTPAVLRKTYFRYPRSLPDGFRRDCQTTNKYLGHVYLLDNLGRIRWTSVGEPAVEEFLIVEKLFRELLARQGNALT